MVVVVGATSHLASGAALSPRRCRTLGAELLLVLEDVGKVGPWERAGWMLLVLEDVGLRAWVLASYRDATIARSAAHNPSTSRIESEAALNPSGLEKNS